MKSALPLTIPHAAQEAATSFGNKVGLVVGAAGWTFRELWQDARASASAQIAAGIRPGSRVAIWAPNRREWILAALGAQIAGAAIVPINTRLKGAEAGELLRRSQAALLFTVGEFLGVRFTEMLAREILPDLETIVDLDTDWPQFQRRGSGSDDPAVDDALSVLSGGMLSDILFTSGTTGNPKGVMTTHDRVIRLFAAWAKDVGLQAEDRYLIANPFFHSFGYKAGWVSCLLTGATIYPVPVFDPAAVVKIIEDERISFLPGPPTVYQSLLSLPGLPDRDLSSLRTAVTGAATVPTRLVRRMQDELGFNCIVNAYGMTECGVITICPPGHPPERVAQTCGRAVSGLQVKCVDEQGCEVSTGEQGEILVRGFGLMLGYLDDLVATDEAIDEDGWLHTGDIGVLDEEEYLRITDRKKDMFISGGFNCYPAEIEAIISAHPAVEAVAVVGVPDERLGEVGKAIIVLRKGESLHTAEFLSWCRGVMANYKVPRSIEAVAALPVNASGKVSKVELRKAFGGR